MTDNHKKDIDHLSGIETTGHEWDGLKELNNPLPRWWVWVWLVSIIWAVWYFVVYPAWPLPGGPTEGTSGYTTYKELAESQKEMFARQEGYLARFEQASFDQILNDPDSADLYKFALVGGRAAFKDNCAMCHGSGAEGGKGYPNLNDDDWLWGGTIDDIYTTLKYGIRSGHDEARVSLMPSFGKDEILSKEEIEDVVDYVMSLSSGEANQSLPGHVIFQDNCSACHGEKGTGGREFGAPNLTDGIWLYGGTKEAIYETVYFARAGVMPNWGERLDDNTIRQLAIYVHELGGGEAMHSDDAANVALIAVATEEMPETVIEEVVYEGVPEAADVAQETEPEPDGPEEADMAQ